MARTNPTAAVADYDGVTVTPGTPDATGDILDPGCTLIVENGSGSSITVTFVSTATFETVDVPDVGGPVAAGATVAFKVPPLRLAGQPSDAAVGAGRVLANYSAVASVTRYVLAAN